MELFEIKHKHSDLIPIAYDWVMKRGCGVAFKELNTITGEYPDVIGFQSSGFSILIEVKVSRNDFLADRKKSFRINPEMGMGTYRFFMCPWGLIKQHELPHGWGLIYVRNFKATCVYHPYYSFNLKGIRPFDKSFEGFINKNYKNENMLMYSALRRLHIKGHIECIYDKQYNYNHKD